MTTDPYREWTAAYVLGVLDAGDRSDFEDHLSGCAECQRALMDFAPIPGLLGSVAERDLEAPSRLLADRAVAAAAGAHSQTVRSRSRWRLVAGALAAAAVALFVVAFAEWAGDADEPQAFPGDPIELTVASDAGATGSIVVRGQDWGTFIMVDLVDLPARDQYTLWVISDDGDREVAGRWGYADTGTCRVPGSTSMDIDVIGRIVVTSTDESDELVWAAGR